VVFGRYERGRVLRAAADSERARAADFGLPASPAGFRHRVPSEIVGDRVVP
jgi:hypothetical protein